MVLAIGSSPVTLSLPPRSPESMVIAETCLKSLRDCYPFLRKLSGPVNSNSLRTRVSICCLNLKARAADFKSRRQKDNRSNCRKFGILITGNLIMLDISFNNSLIPFIPPCSPGIQMFRALQNNRLEETLVPTDNVTSNIMTP